MPKKVGDQREKDRVGTAFPRFLAKEFLLLFPWGHLVGCLCYENHMDLLSAYISDSTVFQINLVGSTLSPLTEINPLLLKSLFIVLIATSSTKGRY